MRLEDENGLLKKLVADLSLDRGDAESGDRKSGWSS
jgi:hypothetical protein